MHILQCHLSYQSLLIVIVPLILLKFHRIKFRRSNSLRWTPQAPSPDSPATFFRSRLRNLLLFIPQSTIRCFLPTSNLECFHGLPKCNVNLALKHHPICSPMLSISCGSRSLLSRHVRASQDIHLMKLSASSTPPTRSAPRVTVYASRTASSRALHLSRASHMYRYVLCYCAINTYLIYFSTCPNKREN
jgi:hypothetical protein